MSQVPVKQQKMGTSVNNFQIMDVLRKEDSMNVWVFNMTSGFKQGTRSANSNIIFTVNVGNNASTLVNIPNTWVPINIGAQVSKDALFENNNFLRAVTQRSLKPITNDEAMEFFRENPDAQETYDLVMSKLGQMENLDDFLPLGMPEEEEELPAGVSPTIINLVARFNAPEQDVSESEAFTMIRNIEKSLTKEDCSYLLSNITSSRIQAFVAKIKK